jgi:hypothetical protein
MTTVEKMDDGITVTRHIVLARVGTFVAEITVQPETVDVRLTAVEGLAAAQVDCLSAGACREPMDASVILAGSGQASGSEGSDQSAPADEPKDETEGGPDTGLGRVGERDAEPPTSADMPGVSGTAYESPSYGYNFEWDQRWQVVDATSADGADDLQLEQDGGVLYVQGYPFDGNAVDCATATSQDYLNDAAYSDFGDLQDGAGNDIGGSDFIHADLAFSATYTAPDGTVTPVAIYVGCWQAHVGPNAVVRFTLVATPDAFPDAYDALQDLLGTLRI